MTEPKSVHDHCSPVLVHSSDLHIYDAPFVGTYTGLKGLAGVLATARSVAADVVLLAGDTFDNHRVSDAALRQAAALIATAGMRVVLLPGNRDPAMADCLFRRAGLVGLPNVHVLGITDPDVVMLGEQSLGIRGRAHRSHDDMPPFHPPRPDTGIVPCTWRMGAFQRTTSVHPIWPER